MCSQAQALLPLSLSLSRFVWPPFPCPAKKKEKGVVYKTYPRFPVGPALPL